MKTWKQRPLRVQYDTFLYDILTFRENFESNEAKWYILTLFETYARRLLGDSIVLHIPLIFIENVDVYFVRWSVGPGLLGLYELHRSRGLLIEFILLDIARYC